MKSSLCIKRIRNFEKNFEKKKADFISADGGFKWKNENMQEQEVMKLLIGEILCALKIQNKNGSFVCKIYESFTTVTLKLICMLTVLYKNVYVAKPLTSRISNSEKYIVCEKYLYDDHPLKTKIIKELENILDIFPKDQFMIDIFPDVNIDDHNTKLFTETNIIVANRQYTRMNEMIKYMKNENYRGDEYHERRNMQIEAGKYWINMFFPSPNEFNEHKKKSVEYGGKINLKFKEEASKLT